MGWILLFVLFVGVGLWGLAPFIAPGLWKRLRSFLQVFRLWNFDVYHPKCSAEIKRLVDVLLAVQAWRKQYGNKQLDYRFHELDAILEHANLSVDDSTSDDEEGGDEDVRGRKS